MSLIAIGNRAVDPFPVKLNATINVLTNAWNISLKFNFVVLLICAHCLGGEANLRL